MSLAATLVANLLQRQRWIAFVGLVVILYVALEMIYAARWSFGRISVVRPGLSRQSRGGDAKLIYNRERCDPRNNWAREMASRRRPGEEAGIADAEYIPAHRNDPGTVMLGVRGPNEYLGLTPRSEVAGDESRQTL